MFKPFILIAVLLAPSAAIAARRIHVRIVVVTMFERGADTGDEPGEFQYWVEREKLDRVISFPQGYRDLRMSGHYSASETYVTIYRFDGHKYRARDCSIQEYVGNRLRIKPQKCAD